MSDNDSLLWQVRYLVYSHFADTTHPPSVDETARHFKISVEEASALYQELHNRHAFFLEPGTLSIRMANPFSRIPTAFKVRANGKTYFANCAWDMFGIPAALHTDAVIEAVCTESNGPVQLEIKNGQITINHLSNVTLSDSEGSLPSKYETLRLRKSLPQSDIQLLVHFPLPFSHWYDDLTFT
jgi:Alkylmercury lyase